MCVKLRSAKVGPGSIFGFKTLGGVTAGKWGLFDGQQYNARSERLDTLYKEYKRGIIYVDSFWEGGKEFTRVDGRNFKIGIVFNPKLEFAVLTCPANELVKPFHHRMPLILADNGAEPWLEQVPVLQLMNQSEFKLNAA